MRLTDKAEPAIPAWGAPGEDDEIALLDISDAFADSFNDAAAFVPEQEGKIIGAENAVLRGEIGVADAAGENAHQRFSRSWSGNEKLFDDAWLIWLASDHASRADLFSHENLLDGRAASAHQIN
jgi:hypothetical protein